MSSLREQPDEARRVLAERRVAIVRTLEEADGGPAAEGSAGPARVDDLQQRAIADQAARLRRRELMRIESALERVASGEYGYCVSCGAVIPEARLESDPAVVLCRDCADRV